MGLIARAIEARGLPTVSLSSAWSITRAVTPPRAVFTDFPLGHTAGLPGNTSMQREIMRAALRAIAWNDRPGQIEALPWQWSADDSWKDRVMRPRPVADRDAAPARAREPEASAVDDRVERHATPQYQTPEDRVAAEAQGHCATCIWLE